MDTDAITTSGDTPMLDRPGLEQRRHPRLFQPFPTTARGVDSFGNGFDISTVLANFSARGLYLQLSERLEPGAKLFAIVRLGTTRDSALRAPRVAVRGVVMRIDPKPDGRNGVAVRFTRHRFV